MDAPVPPRRSRAIAYGLGALAVACFVLSVGCGTAADPVESGAICSPATDGCPSNVRVVRSGRGRNLLDVAVENRGPNAEVVFDVSFEASTDATGGSDAADRGDVGTGSGSGIFPVRYQLASTGETTDRFRSTEIFSRKELFLEVDCSPKPDCDVRAEYVFASQREECESNDDCAGQQLCKTNAGICVACLSDDDCRADQNCHPPTGRCLPPGGSGCSAARPTLPLGGASWGLLLLFFVARRLRSAAARFGARTTAAGAALVVLLCAPSVRSAPPGSTVTVGTGPRWVLGPIGDNVKRGLGIELHEIVRWRHIGVSAWIETNYFVTTQDPPPLSKELQLFAFGLGPRAFYAIGPVELTAGPDYQRVGFGPNALVRETGTNANFNSVGGTFAAGYRFSQFVVRLGAQYQPILEIDGAILSVNASFGISTR